MSHGSMYFHTSIHNTILFEQWHTMTWEELLGSCIGLAVLAALYEGFKVGREYLEYRMLHGKPKQNQVSEQHNCECNATDETSTQTTGDSTVIAIGDGETTKKNTSRPAIISARHLVQTGLHFVQLWIGFCLMLVFMTYSVYLCLAITIGGAIGYFCFAWMRPISMHSSSSSVTGAYGVDCCN